MSDSAHTVMAGPLAGLDPQQRAAVTTLRGPLVVHAGAGTGKTRVITHRIAHGVDTGAYSPARVLAVTFTSKAAGQMRARLRALGVTGVSARTFHAAALAQLNYFWPTVAGDSAPALVDNKARVLAHAADQVGVGLDKNTLRDVAAEIEWRKRAMIPIDQYPKHRPAGVGRWDAHTVADVQAAYEKVKDDRRQMDFEDVLLACAGMIEAESRVAATIHEQYRHFTVDEFQDVSALQFRLLQAWLGERTDVCVVGDAHQTVFSFAGADPRYLREFDTRFPGAQTVRLETNYRSQQGILDVANELMRDRGTGLTLRAQNTELGPMPRQRSFPDDTAEAQSIAQDIARRISDGVDPHTIAVLYRSHAQSAEIARALTDCNIATTVLGGTRFFDMIEVRQALMALRAAAVAPVETGFVDTVRDVLRSLGLGDEPPQAGGVLREAWEARMALLRLARNAPAATTVREFADDLLARAKSGDEPTMATVTLATLHSAKGLEWDHVYLLGLAEGLLPVSYATTCEQIDEERRMAYVGITRAARTLQISWAGGPRGRQPSRFLQEIGTRTLRAGDAPARSAATS